MAEKNRHIDSLISFYIDDELTEEQRREVETHLKQCESCQELLKAQQQGDGLIKEYVSKQAEHLSTEELLAYQEKQKLSAWQRNVIESHLESCVDCQQLLQAVETLDEMEPEVAKQKKLEHTSFKEFLHQIKNLLFRKPVISSAVAVAVMALIIFLIVKPEPHRYGSLVQISPAPYAATELRGEQNRESFEKFQQGMKVYRNNNFTAAEQPLREAADSQTDNPQFQFYCGLTLLLNQKYEAGLDHLEQKVIRQSVYHAPSLWYISQAYLKLEEPETAITYLKELSETDSQYSVKATELLNKIDTIRSE